LQNSGNGGLNSSLPHFSAKFFATLLIGQNLPVELTLCWTISYSELDLGGRQTNISPGALAVLGK